MSEEAIEEAAKAAAKWLDKYTLDNKIERDNLTPAQWFHLVMQVPCSIRCWRIGQPVTVKPGEVCPECGKLQPVPDVWDRLRDDDDEPLARTP